MLFPLLVSYQHTVSYSLLSVQLDAGRGQSATATPPSPRLGRGRSGMAATQLGVRLMYDKKLTGSIGAPAESLSPPPLPACLCLPSPVLSLSLLSLTFPFVLPPPAGCLFFLSFPPTSLWRISGVCFSLRRAQHKEKAGVAFNADLHFFFPPQVLRHEFAEIPQLLLQLPLFFTFHVAKKRSIKCYLTARIWENVFGLPPPPPRGPSRP